MGARNKLVDSHRRARSAFRKRIDRLRVSLWYALLVDLSGGASCYALEKELMPESFTRTLEGTLSHRHRMAHYSRGEHVPRNHLVARVERLYPGTLTLLNHVLWQILDPDMDIQVHRDSWISELDRDSFAVLFKSIPATFISPAARLRRPLTVGLLHKLERLGTLDALAAALLLLRESIENGRHAQAFMCADSLWILLLLIGGTKLYRDKIKELTEVVSEGFPNTVVHRGQQVALAFAPIDFYVTLLIEHCRERVETGVLSIDPAKWRREQIEVIRGTRRPELRFALKLPTVAAASLQLDPGKYAAFQEELRIREIALRYCEVDWRSRSFLHDFRAYLRDPMKRWPVSTRQAND